MRTDTVFLTGSTGFVGRHVLAAMREAGYFVRALVRDGGRLPPAEGVTFIAGDLQRPGELLRAMDGCRYVVHCAALYSFAPVDRPKLREVNVRGTAGIMEAAHLAGVERVVLTSSSATLGACVDDRPRTEDDWPTERAADSYHHSKLEQERAAFAGRVPLVALLPTAPIGPGDAKPTPTGSMVLDFANGKIVAMPPRGGMNLVPVEDVAQAHVAALQARTGERYILGGENLTLDAIWALLAQITGRPLPRWRIPNALALAAAHVDELRCRILPAAHPAVPLEGVRMSMHKMYASSEKARKELGFAPGSVLSALERAVRWYREQRYCA